MAAAALFSTAQGLFGGSKLAASYTIQQNSGPGNGGGAGSPSAVVGLWSVQNATHKSNGKSVSIWTFDKNSVSPSGGKGKAKLDLTADVLKKEVSMLSRLRHPCVLEVVEPLEETRSSLTFATEQVSSCLRAAINASGSSRSRRASPSSSPSGTGIGELDEIEIQKGLLQIGKALQFLHESAKLVHSNLTPDAIVINAKGDWKLSGFGLSTYLTSPTGQQAKWEFPAYDRYLPQAVQKDFDYMAPEYALDETLAFSNDMYALGCIISAIHTKSGPPFSNHGSLQSLRDNVENLASIRAGWHRLGDEVQDVLSQLLTRYPSTRLTASSFQSSRYFSSILVSTLRFLDRDNFAAKPREEQVSFLKGLLKVLPQFSDKVIKRKILPSLLEETRKNMLVPFLLPCIFFIGNKMDNDEFREAILPHIKPLFGMKDPPQAMLTLLDNLPVFQAKCSAAVFREEVLPLIYTALDSDAPPILEKALKVIPNLSETLDYTTVKTLLLPKITAVFSKTTSLAVKVTTLVCFRSLVPILDKFTLTEKLVPLLARIKTKEPSVMIGTLGVHEQIGLKCDIQAIATLVLPQLWAMSITPLLSAEQFARFMQVIKQLGSRVEEEHSRHLAEIKRLEETSGNGSSRNGASTSLMGEGLNGNGEVDFEALVRGGASLTTGSGASRSVTPDPFGSSDDMARFDSLSLSISTRSPSISSQTLSPPSVQPSRAAPMRLGSQGAAPTHSTKAASFLGARPISAQTYQARNGLVGAAGGITPDSSLPSSPTLQAPPSSNTVGLGGFAALPPPISASSNASQQRSPLFSSPPGQQQQTTTYGGPNYNISLTPQAPSSQAGSMGMMQPLQPSSSSSSSFSMAPMQHSTSSNAPTLAPAPSIQWNRPSGPASPPSSTPALQPSPAIQWGRPNPQPAASVMTPNLQQPPPGFGSVLQPTKKETNFDWSDLDPMR